MRSFTIAADIKGFITRLCMEDVITSSRKLPFQWCSTLRKWFSVKLFFTPLTFMENQVNVELPLSSSYLKDETCGTRQLSRVHTYMLPTYYNLYKWSPLVYLARVWFWLLDKVSTSVMAFIVIVHCQHRDLFNEEIMIYLLMQKVSMPTMYYCGKGHSSTYTLHQAIKINPEQDILVVIIHSKLHKTPWYTFWTILLFTDKSFEPTAHCTQTDANVETQT